MGNAARMHVLNNFSLEAVAEKWLLLWGINHAH